MSEVQALFSHSASGLGTLGAGASILVATAYDTARTTASKILKARFGLGIVGKTAGEGDISWGCCANLTAAQVTELINLDRQDRQSAEAAVPPGAWLKMLGVIPLAMTSGPISNVGALGTQGMYTPMMDVKVNWVISEGQGFSLWFHNHDSGALTTGTVVRGLSEVVGVDIND